MHQWLGLSLELTCSLSLYIFDKQTKAYSGGLQEKYGDKIEKILYGPEEDGYAVGSLKDKKKPIIFRRAHISLLLSPLWEIVVVLRAGKPRMQEFLALVFMPEPATITTGC